MGNTHAGNPEPLDVTLPMFEAVANLVQGLGCMRNTYADDPRLREFNAGYGLGIGQMEARLLEFQEQVGVEVYRDLAEGGLLEHRAQRDLLNHYEDLIYAKILEAGEPVTATHAKKLVPLKYRAEYAQPALDELVTEDALHALEDQHRPGGPVTVSYVIADETLIKQAARDATDSGGGSGDSGE